MNKIATSGKKYVIPMIVLVISLLMIATSCTNTGLSNQNESAKATSAQSTPVQATEGAAINSIESNAVQMADAEKTVTLVGYGSKGALADNNLSIADMLIYAAQDEYLAHKEYATIIGKFGNQNPYSNIVKSEETHLSMLKELYVTYGMTFPEDTSSEQLVVPNNLLDAAKTGVQAEIDNIAMYERFLTYKLPDDIRSVFESLKAASKSHLEAFQKQVDKLS